MKNLLFISIALLLSITTYAQRSKYKSKSQFKPFVTAEFGYESFVTSMIEYNNDISYYFGLIEMCPSKTHMKLLNNSLISEIYIGFTYKNIKIYSGTKVYYIPNNLVSYKPLYQTYTLGATYTPNKHISFKIEHMCGHSIDRSIYKSAYDRATIKFSY